MPIRVILPGLDVPIDPQFIEIVGATSGSSTGHVQNGTLVGPFRLKIGAFISDIRNAAGFQGQVTQIETDVYRLERVFKWRFAFSTPIECVYPSGPRLKCDRVVIHKDDSRETMAYVPHMAAQPGPHLSISLQASVAPATYGLLYFPKRNIQGDVLLRGHSHPSYPSWRRPFLLRRQDGFVINFGIAHYISLNHLSSIATPTCTVGISGLYSLGDFYIAARNGQPIGQSDVSVRFTSIGKGDTASIRVHRSTRLGVHVPNTSVPSAWSKTPATKIEIVGSWLSVRAPKAPELVLERLSSTNGQLSDPTQVYASSDRIAFNLPLVTPTSADAAHFSYLDSSVPDGGSKPPTAIQQRYGLRIHGLHWTKNGPAILDANALRIALLQNEFQFQAGGPISICGVSAHRLLVPKKNRALNWLRIVDIPTAILRLRVDATDSSFLTVTPIEFDTAGILNHSSAQLKIYKPQLVGPPLSASSRAANAAPANAPAALWKLQKSELFLKANDAGVFPEEGRIWQDGFVTWNDHQFALAEHPGAQLLIDPGGRTQVAVSTSTAVTTKNQNGTDVAVYKSLSVLLQYPKIDCECSEHEHCLPEEAIRWTVADLEAIPVTKETQLASLRLVYWDASSTAPEQFIEEFIDDNLQAVGDANITRFFWPLMPGLAVDLWNAGQFAPAIIRQRNQYAKPGLAFDWAAKSALGATDLGYATWDVIASVNPELWPRRRPVSGEIGSRLDPSDERWRGIFCRDLPLRLLWSPPANAVRGGCPFLEKLFNVISERLLLRYGWKDESGSSWVATIKPLPSEPSGGIELNPPEWRPYLKMTVPNDDGFRSTGAAGHSLFCEGFLNLSIPLLIDTVGAPLTAGGTFTINLSNGATIDNVVVQIDNPAIFNTHCIPGFKSVQCMKIVTDFQTLQVSLNAWATDELASVLPFLPRDTARPGIGVKITFELTSTPSIRFELLLPAAIDALFAQKWPFRVESMLMNFGRGPQRSLRIGGTLNLGVSDFIQTRAAIVLSGDGSGAWNLNIEDLDIKGGFSVGDLRLDGQLKWSKDNSQSDPLPSNQIAQAGERDFWGYLALKHRRAMIGPTTGPGVEIAVKIGSSQGIAYWVGALKATNVNLPLSIATIQDPCLVLAHRADKGNVTTSFLTSADLHLLTTLRYSGDPFTWLNTWTPSNQVGTLAALSGYLQGHEYFAASPAHQDQYLSSLAFLDSGIRCEAWIKVLSTLPLRLAVAVGPHSFMASCEVPAVGFPPASPEIVVKGGQLTFGIGYGNDDHDKYLLIEIGWPPKVPGSEFERDWQRATSVVVDNAFPINTYMGGLKLAYNHGARSICLGYAVRAGWTKKYQVGGEVAGGSAEIGIMVGGVMEFGMLWSRDDSPTRMLEYLPQSNANSDKTYDDLIVQALKERDRFEIAIDYQLFADIWGRASVQLLGVTIAGIDISARARFHVCGGTSGTLIRKVDALVGFHVEITIGCVHTSASAEIVIVLIDGSCGNALIQACGVDDRHIAAMPLA